MQAAGLDNLHCCLPRPAAAVDLAELSLDQREDPKSQDSHQSGRSLALRALGERASRRVQVANHVVGVTECRMGERVPRGISISLKLDRAACGSQHIYRAAEPEQSPN